MQRTLRLGSVASGFLVALVLAPSVLLAQGAPPPSPAAGEPPAPETGGVAPDPAAAPASAPPAVGPLSPTVPTEQAPPSDTAEAGSDAHKIDLTTPAPAPPIARTYRIHDGFYLRAAVGYGQLGLDHDYSGTGADVNLEGSGSGLAADLWIGVGPVPGMTLGGGISLTQAFSVSLEASRFDAGQHSLGLALLGPFFDAYPTSSQGWHLGALVGAAGLNLDGGSLAGPDVAWGFGGSVWGGYDWWVAEEWSVGALLRFQAATAHGSKGAVDVDATALGLGLTLGVVYN